MLVRQLIFRAYKKAPKEYISYWYELSNYAQKMVKAKELELTGLNYWHRFLMYLYLKKNFNLIRKILIFYKK